MGKEFEGIYQEYAEDFVGWEAHYGNARILQEEGRNKEARDYFEEVQAADASDVPDAGAGEKQPAVPRVPRKSQPDWEDNFFSAVERQYLKVLYAVDRNGDQGYYKEFKDWRKMHGPSREKCPEYQGLTLDYARQLIQAIGTAKDAAKQRAYKQQALELLSEMIKVESPYRPDAIELRRQLNPNAAPDQSFDGLVLDANKAAADKDWTAAGELYAKALELAAKKTSKTPKEKVAGVRNYYVGCIHNQALELYNKHQVDQAVVPGREGRLQSGEHTGRYGASRGSIRLDHSLLPNQQPAGHGGPEASQRQDHSQGRRAWEGRSSASMTGPRRKRPIPPASFSFAWPLPSAIWLSSAAARPRPPRSKPRPKPPLVQGQFQ